ncbi:sulfurtransferase [Leucobacter sp. HY1908]
MADRSTLLVTPADLAQEIGALRQRSADLAAPAVPADLAAPAAQRSGSGRAPRILVLDVRWSLAAPDGRAAFAAGHIPGAVYVDLDTELASHGPATSGRHPLPSDEVLTGAARRWGLRPGDRVVAYDGGGNLAAARAWWVLRDAGIDVRLLDGAWPAWQAAGLPVETGEGGVIDTEIDAATDTDTHTRTQPLAVAGGHMPRLSMDEAAALAREGVLLDARAAERYSGDTEPVDPRAGHIPGARSVPTTLNIDADGKFLSRSQLRERFAAVGVQFDAGGPTARATGIDSDSDTGIDSDSDTDTDTDTGIESDTDTATGIDSDTDVGAELAASIAPASANGAGVGAYCGSGVTASHTLFALELAGVRGALFPGSWSQWSNDPERPVATAPRP